MTDDMTAFLTRLGMAGDLDNVSEAGRAILGECAARIDDITHTDLQFFRTLWASEEYRRTQLASIPGKIAELSEAYERAGGDRANLIV
ncbi:hypothetical protein [Cutibacterium avidum]|uniref:hypothetical protein n=1 Tax=Cutibacterium avidum TaxID=33010 RepID=UPI002FF28581